MTNKPTDLEFALVCLKQLEPTKPDFQKVADALGGTSKSACYHRHWRMMKDFTMNGAPSNVAPPTPKKRGRRAKSIVNNDEDDDAHMIANEGSDQKRTKRIKKDGKDIKGKTKIDAIDILDEDAEVKVEDGGNDADGLQSDDEATADTVPARNMRERSQTQV